MGPRKQPIAKVVAPNECLTNVKFVLDEKFTKKCQNLAKDYREAPQDTKLSFGVRISKAGAISEDQIQVMAKYHRTMETLAAVPDAVEWVAATCMNMLDIPEGLEEYAELDKEAATAALKRIILPMSRD
ncbi:hypothetical protein PI124_g2741 [Phytophthora idaei]|nr:hypothetical protein PI125_g15485 [Phytophthora idaei]KAG3252670.1 hypothetical protein PI124_g2741 [Phytophthora idaei]